MKKLIFLSVLLISACSTDDSSDEKTGQTIILTLDNVSSNIVTNDVWTEENINLSFVSATADDCGIGSSSFGVEATFVWLYPSRLSLDLSSLQNIQKVEVDINDWCSIDCTQAFLIDSSGVIINNTGNTLILSPETLILENSSGGFISELAISSCEGQIHEVRVYQN